jgi:hypothetical protein
MAGRIPLLSGLGYLPPLNPEATGGSRPQRSLIHMEGFRGRCLDQQVKLKGSCDPCSTSKVRCTREKPSCSRCEKLGHQCYYSPARRFGRPNRSLSELHDPPASPPRNVQNDPPDDQVPRPPSASSSVRETDPWTLNQPSQLLDEPSEPAASDCLDVLLDTLCRLGREKTIQSSDSADASLKASVKILSRVLICPCSQSIDVALLAASVCHSLLDLVDALIQPPSSGYSLGSTASATSAHITYELRLVANLVVQFASRYYGVLDEELRETLLGYTGELKTRLRALIEKATG